MQGNGEGETSQNSDGQPTRNDATQGTGDAQGGAAIPSMSDIMNMGRGGFGMTSETWGQVAARAAMLAAQLRELEVANSQQNPAATPNPRQQLDEASNRGQDQQNPNGGMWMPPNPMSSFGAGQDLPPGMPLPMFGQPGIMPDRMVQDYRMRFSQQMPGLPMGAGGVMTQDDLIRSLHGLPPGALLAAGIPLGDGFRRPKAGLAAETRRHNDKEKKRRKRERIGELVKAVRRARDPRRAARRFPPSAARGDII